MSKPASPAPQSQPKAQPKSEPRVVTRDGVSYRITLPNWGQWLAMLDRSARGLDAGGQADVARLLRLWLSGSTEVMEGASARPLGSVDELPATLADALVAQGSAALAEAAEDLAIVTEHLPGGGLRVGTAQGDYDLRPLTFGERNACLSRHLGLAQGVPEVDASGYELALVAASITAPQGLRVPDLMALPLPLGEALVSAARNLSDSAPDAELAAFAAAGQAHPDLELADLCLAFGMTPQEAMALPATTARRLRAAAGLIRASQPQAVMPAPAQMPMQMEDDRVTRIVVHDD